MNVMSPTAYEKNEWKRMAADAFLHDRIATAVKFKDYGNLESYEKLCVQDYDAIMAEYRNWLLFGFGSKGLRKPEVNAGCTHNEMVERVGDKDHAWQCNNCGHVYGENGTHSNV